MTYFNIETPTGIRSIGTDKPCFVIAELSGNHGQKFEQAVQLVRAASHAGADAVKLQTYTPDTLTIDSDLPWFRVNNKDNPELWKGQKLYDLYKTAFTPWEWFPKLKELTESLGMVFFSSAYDQTSVDFLEQLPVALYKVASYEATDLITLRAVAKTQKPVILSTGFATSEEISYAVETLKKYGSGDIALLHCVTEYEGAANFDAMNLATIQDLANRYKVVSGFSDNNAGIDVPLVAFEYGASILEKHLTMSRAEGGPDARFSVEPEELKSLVAAIRKKESGEDVSLVSDLDKKRMFGKVNYGCQSEKEKQNTFFRRSLFVVKDMKAGDIFSPDNVRSIRPSAGIAPKHYDEVMGKHAASSIPRGTPLSWDLIL